MKIATPSSSNVVNVKLTEASSSHRSKKDVVIVSDANDSNDDDNDSDDNGLKFVEKIKAAAQAAVEQNGFVYEPTSGLYYDNKTGYYYNAVIKI